jgi:phage major head subunit gpT-like protein
MLPLFSAPKKTDNERSNVMGAQGLGSRAIIGKFFNILETELGTSWIDLISLLFQSDQASEEYKWLGMSPAMREWIGGRQAHGFRENGLTITNKKFEATMEVPCDWIRRDKTGQIDVRIGELARRAVEHWAKLLSTFITNGTGATSGYCYDGHVFFDTDHSEGDSGTQLNLLAAGQVAALNVTTPTAPTPVEAAKAILGVIGYMLTYLDDKGEPMNDGAKNFLVMTSPTLWQFLAPAVYSPLVSAGETNPLAAIMANTDFRVAVVANSRLAYTTQFVVLRTDAKTKPFIRQEEEGVTSSALAEGSDEEFNNDRWLFGVKALRNIGYGYWQQAAHATLE